MLRLSGLSISCFIKRLLGFSGLLWCLLGGPVAAAETTATCETLLEEAHRQQLENRQLNQELVKSLRMISEMKQQMERLLALQNALLQRLEQQVADSKK